MRVFNAVRLVKRCARALARSFWPRKSSNSARCTWTPGTSPKAARRLAASRKSRATSTCTLSRFSASWAAKRSAAAPLTSTSNPRAAKRLSAWARRTSAAPTLARARRLPNTSSGCAKTISSSRASALPPNPGTSCSVGPGNARDDWARPCAASKF